MTSTSSKSTAKTRQVLRIVPPKPQVSAGENLPANANEIEKPEKTRDSVEKKEITASSPQPETQSSTVRNSLRKWATVGAVVVGLGAIASIPIPNYVTGQAAIISRPEARQKLTMPESGRVEIYVKTNDRVRPGDTIAQVRSDDLDNRIAQAERGAEQAKQGVRSAQQDLILAQARLSAAQNSEAIARSRADRQRQEATNSYAMPQVQRLKQERASIPGEITAIEAEIGGIESDIIGLRGQLAAASQTLQSYQSVVDEGIIPKKLVWEAESQQATLESAIAQKQSQIKSRRGQIEQKQRLMAAKSAQMQEASKQLQDTLYRQEDELSGAIAQTQTARREVESAAAKIQSQQQLVAKWEADLQQLQQQQSQLTLKATTAGTVVTPDLDLRSGNHLPAGEEILSVVDLRQLTAQVQVRQEDKDLVKPNATVGFFRQGDGTRHGAVVEDKEISPVLNSPETQQKPMLNVGIAIDNQQNLLSPGMKGYAHIQTEKLRIYQKVGHEFNKLFNLGQYFPWLSGE